MNESAKRIFISNSLSLSFSLSLDFITYLFLLERNFRLPNTILPLQVSGDQAYLIRERESYEEQFSREKTVREEIPLSGTHSRSRPGDLKEESPTEENK